MPSALLELDSPRLDSRALSRRSGKVREVYDLGDNYLIVSTDRLSAFDVVLPTGIPDKGRVLNQMSAFWFDFLKDVVPNHVISTSDNAIADALGFDDPNLHGRCTLAKKAQPLTIECVVRGYLAGSFAKEYRNAVAQNGVKVIQGIPFPSDLMEGSKLPSPVFTPATKAEEGHDENISLDHARDIVGESIADSVMELSLTIFEQATAHAAMHGLILADTKFEFGLTDEGIIWIDEALTPDSSRYWEASEYRPGASQPGFDKQFVRDWLEASGWNKQYPGPALPLDVIAKTRDKYVAALERVTGATLEL